MCDCGPIRRIVRAGRVPVVPARKTLVLVAVLLAVPLLIALSSSALAGDAEESGGGTAAVESGAEIQALQYEVRDLERAVDFYSAALGFEVERREASGEAVRLRLGPMRLNLVRSDARPAPSGSARIYLNLSVANLEDARAAVVAAGGEIRSDGALQSAVGPYLEVTDPSGNQLHLIDHQWDDEQAADKQQPPITPAVFNIGLAVRSIEPVEKFLAELGFVVATRDYLPETLVFEQHGVAYLVVHGEADADAGPTFATGALVVAVADPDALAAPGDGQIQVRGPSGNAFLLSGRGSSGGDHDRAVDAFERIKELQGEWHARSTRGWEETIQFEVTARGSVVVETNRFKDAPDRTMHTMYYIDGDRLMLTHYCEAMNQPRLLASDIGDGGRRVVFTFVDGANIATRSVGHMDKAVYQFIDQDHFTSQWTWYEAGKESWMEEIVLERLR